MRQNIGQGDTYVTHHVFYNEKERRIEMHLISNLDHIVRIDDTAVAFAKGETIHTENSYKYSLQSFEDIVEQAGFAVSNSWLDDDELFSVHYLEVAK